MENIKQRRRKKGGIKEVGLLQFIVGFLAFVYQRGIKP